VWRRRWRVIRVALALALIFIAGMATGRWTAPRSVTSMQFRPLPPPVQAQGNPDVAISHMLAYIDLSPEQIAAIRPILTKWAAEIQGVAPMSEERKEAFLKYSPLIRRELEPEQHQAYDAMVESMKARAIRKQKKRWGP
jgi:hypothetical protein